VIEVLTPIGVKVERESLARPLAGLPDEQIVSAMTQAKALAGDKPLTAKFVAQAAEKYRTKPSGEPVTRPRPGKAARRLDLAPAMKLLAKVEKAVGESDLDQLKQDLAALRECLEALATADGQGVMV
jgi:hypothetical protein